MTPTTREKFDLELNHNNYLGLDPIEVEAIIDWHEKEIEEARQQGREEMKKEVRDLMNEWDDYIIFEEHFNQL